MCGIIGYIGKRNFVPIAKQGLLNLEYRGYDSAGISFFNDTKVETIKQKGDVEKLFEKIDNHINCHCGIGHTRWATHGVPSDANSHPHSSQKGLFTIVHNGIIENYKDLKEKFVLDYTFKSETDTEIIANLLEYFYLQNKNVLHAIKQCVNLLKGSFALAILFSKENDKIYFARNKSPLVIGKGKNENFISSDLIGIGDETNKYIIIDDLCYGFITSQVVKTYSFDGKTVKNEIKTKKKSVFKTGKGNYPHYMLKEIFDIQLGIETTTKLYSKKGCILNKIPVDYWENINEVVIIACGTSYHSALIGEKYIKQIAEIKCSCRVASEFIYGKEILDSNTLCIFISQSGETADTLTAITKAKRSNAKTLGITNVQTSSITTLCDYILPLCAGTEIAVASTKAYNCQLVVLFILANFLKERIVKNKCLSQLKKCNKELKLDKYEKIITPLIAKLQNAKNIYMIGRDYDYITSLEACLKLKEITYIPCEAYPAGELKHGTLALITKNIPAIAIITEKDLIGKTMMIVEQVKARGGEAFIFTCFDLSKYNIKGCTIIYLPDMQFYLKPIYSIIPFQFLAYKMALSLGYNPDRPRNLAKSVTVE